MRRFVTVILAFFLGLSSCVRNPVTGRPQLSLISESQEIAMGKQAAEEVVQTIGLYDDRRLSAFVSQMGERLAKSSERPNLPWSFHVVNDAAVNAFALPGGQIFVTRGIVTHLTSEAELASVLGHEVGHVAAKHSVAMISRAQLAQLGLGIGSVFVPSLEKFGGLLGTGLGLLFLQYGRDAERQADELGFRYALSQGYDVRAMGSLFTMLGRVEGGGRLPEWLSTHPSPENRRELIEQRIANTKNVDFDRLLLGRDSYLALINGVAFGIDRSEGYFRDTLFIHPRLRFQLQFPMGWKTENQPRAVVARGPEDDAAVKLGLVANLSAQEAARQFFRQPGVEALDVGNARGKGARRDRVLPSRDRRRQAGGPRVVLRIWRQNVPTSRVHDRRAARPLRARVHGGPG